MAVMNKSSMKKLVEGQFISGDSSREVLLRHLPDIAIASHGNDRKALQDVLKPYIAELEELVDDTDSFAPSSPFFLRNRRKAALNYLEWLRTL